MARPERNDVDYFPHPVDHGKKMYYLDQKYKNDGYSIWFRTLEELGKTNYHFLDFRDEAQLMYMSSKCNVSEELYIEVIGVLVKFGEFDRRLWEEHMILWNQKFVKSIEEAYKKRINDCITYKQLIKKLGFPDPDSGFPDPETQKGTENSEISAEISPKSEGEKRKNESEPNEQFVNKSGFPDPETRKQPTKPDPETRKQVNNRGNSGGINPQRRVKKSKEKKRKEEKKNDASVSEAPLYRKFYQEEFVKTEGHPLRQKYFFIVKYLLNMTPNIINEPGVHILKLKKQMSFEDFCKLYNETKKRGITIKDLLDSWLNNPTYSKGKISVYATLLKWAQKEPIKGTNHSGSDSSFPVKKNAPTPLVKTTIGQQK